MIAEVVNEGWLGDLRLEIALRYLGHNLAVGGALFASFDAAIAHSYGPDFHTDGEPWDPGEQVRHPRWATTPACEYGPACCGMKPPEFP